MASAECYNGGLGAVRKSPLEAEHFLCYHMPEMAQSCYLYEVFYGHSV